MTDATTEALQHRLTELEIKAAYAEDLLDVLNMTVARQQAVIDQLVQEVQALREQAGQSASGATFRSLRDELPPHY